MSIQTDSISCGLIWFTLVVRSEAEDVELNELDDVVDDSTADWLVWWLWFRLTALERIDWLVVWLLLLLMMLLLLLLLLNEEEDELDDETVELDTDKSPDFVLIPFN